MPLAQGEVWHIDYAEGFDRPGIVITRGELNGGSLVLTVPCTGANVEERAQYANNVLLRVGDGGLQESSVAQVHLIQPTEISFFRWKYGQLTEEQLGSVLQALAWAVDLFPG